MLAGCYASHAPWARAAPDGSAIWMRVELHGGRASGGSGILQVRFDGTYVASPMNELRVCTGTLERAELDGWIALIETTGAFGLDGPYGDVIDGGVTEVRLASEDGLATRFTLRGGPAAGYDPALARFEDRAEAFWATLDLDACAPAGLDSASSTLSAWIDPFDPSRAEGVQIEVGHDGAIGVFFGYGYTSWEDELEPCAPLAEPERFWATVLAAAPFDPSRPDEAWRDVFVNADSEVAAADGTTHERWVHFNVHPSRPEQARLQDALIALVETHCGP